MSHRIEGVLALARAYQLPLWIYSPHPQLNPYLLASLGFKPVARGVLECHLCLTQIILTEQLLENPQRVSELARKHQQNCLYANEEPSPITKEELFLALDDITAEMELGKATITTYPLLDSKAIVEYTAVSTFLLKKVLSLYQMSLQNFKISFLLKMFGWYLTRQEEKDSIACYFCGRNLPLDRFESSKEDHQVERAGEAQKQGGKEAQRFNPASEHRYFCLMVGKEQHWLLFLQQQEDKFAQTCSFKFKTTPLQSQRMRMHIDKYIETAKEKIEGALSKLRSVTHQCGILCGQLGKDKNIGVEGEEHETELKRIRDHDHSLQLTAEAIGRQLNRPLKKIRFN